MIKSTHLTVKPGRSIATQSFNMTLQSIDESIAYTLKKGAKSVDMTGTYGWFPNGGIIDAAWQILVSFGGRMDVVAAFTDNLVISVNNPTFGYPYTIFVDMDNGQGGFRYNYYEGESHTYVDSKGRSFTCTRNEDTNTKEFIIEDCA